MIAIDLYMTSKKIYMTSLVRFSMKFFDLHEDFGWSSQFVDVVDGEEQSSLRLLSSFEATVILGVVYPHVRSLDERAELLSALYGRHEHSTVPSMDVLWNQVNFYRHLERAKGVKILEPGEVPRGGISFILSLEGTDVLRYPYEVHALSKLGIRVVGLTWNYDTKFAASCMSKKDYGLTGEGEELVKFANSQGIILDVSHASKRTVLDVCSTSKLPVIASHSNARALKEHPRNLDDQSLAAIAKTGGVVGVTAINSTLAKRSIGDLVANANYIGETFGWDHVALGTDFLGVEETPEGFGSVLDIRKFAEELGEMANQVLWENPARVLLR